MSLSNRYYMLEDELEDDIEGSSSEESDNDSILSEEGDGEPIPGRVSVYVYMSVC